jgi:DNA polymerase
MKLMIIGESPSHTRPNGKENVHFSGRTSHILWEELKEYGITRKHCIVTNTVEDKLPKGKKPTPSMIEENRERIAKLIKEEKPNVIMTMGKVASQALLEHDVYIKSQSGVPFYSDKYNNWIVPILHPSAVARDPNLKDKFEESIYEAISKGVNNGYSTKFRRTEVPNL